MPRVEALEDRNLLDANSFVNALYIDLLNRQASAGEVQGWVGLLNSGASTTQVALDFLNSPEYARDQIRADYEQILGREPEAGAVANWMPLFNSPGGPQTTEALFLASNEFFRVQGGTTAGWLAGVYVQALNRGLDPGGQAIWTAALQNGASRYAVANTILNSTEGLGTLVTNDDWTFLRRQADSGGVNFWVSVMQKYGVTPTQTLSNLLGSSEYFQNSGTVTLHYASVQATGITPDTGVSATDGITNNPKLSVIGAGTANSVFTVYIDNVKDVSGITDSNGNFSIALSHPLAQGTHSLLAIAHYQGTSGMTFTAVVDTTAPSGTLTVPDFVETTTPTVTVAGSDNTSQTFTYAIDVDLKHDGSFTEPGDAGFATGSFSGGQTQVTLPALPEGTYNLQARVYDAAGNLATSSAGTMQVDPNAGFLGDHWLIDLYNYNQSHLPGPHPGPPSNLNPNIFLYDSTGRVLVDVRSTLTKYMGTLQTELQGLGMTILMQQPSQNMLVGYLPINQILNMANLAHFASATAVLKPQTRVGSVDTEGDQVIAADVFRQNTGFDGSGVGVGILSDSVSQFAGGLADSVATGDLPNNVLVLQDGPAGLTDEGRAMLEIVDDIAPGASLAFHTAFISPQNFAQGILDLANVAGSRVIADDVGYADEPMFNDGIIAQAANQVQSQGVFYASAAGNAANQAWTDAWNPVSATVGGTTGTFETSAGWSGPGNAVQLFTLPANGLLRLSFQWDSAFLEGGSPLPNFQVPNDLGILVTDATGTTTLQTFDTNNKNTDEAWEFVDFTNPNNTATQFGLAFFQNNPTTDPAPTALRWVDFGGDDPQAIGEGSASTFGHPAANGAVAVGAVPWFSPDTPESFTSQGGPLTILFDADGNRLATPEIRNKPEVAAPDGVSTSFFGDPFGSQAHAFFGTSAATPHVAGAAALLLQQAPSATPDQLTQHLELTAIDVPVAGFDNLTGFGRIIVTPIQVVFPADRFESNDTSDVATQFGTLATGSTVITDLTIGNHANGLSDYDWYQFSAGADGTVTATITRKDGGDLELHLFTVDSNGTLIDLGTSATPRAKSQTLSAAFSAGQIILVEVKGRETSLGVWGQGSYDLEMDLV